MKRGRSVKMWIHTNTTTHISSKTCVRFCTAAEFSIAATMWKEIKNKSPGGIYWKIGIITFKTNKQTKKQSYVSFLRYKVERMKRREMPPHDLKRYVGKLSPKFHWWCPNASQLNDLLTSQILLDFINKTASQIYFLNDSLWKMQHKATKIKSDWIFI